MYRIKPKKGYNVVLKDMGLVLRTENEEWINVDKTLFDNSLDAKRLKNLIIIDDKNSTKENNVKKDTTDNVHSNVDKTFVVGNRTYQNPDNVFVKLQNEIVDPVVKDRFEKNSSNEIDEHKDVDSQEELIQNDLTVENYEKSTSDSEIKDKPIENDQQLEPQKQIKNEKKETKLKVSDNKSEKQKKETKKNKK